MDDGFNPIVRTPKMTETVGSEFAMQGNERELHENRMRPRGQYLISLVLTLPR